MRNTPAVLLADFPTARAQGSIAGIGKELLAVAGLQCQEITTIVPMGMLHRCRCASAIAGLDLDISRAQEQCGAGGAIEGTGSRHLQALPLPVQQGLFALMFENGNLQGADRAAQAGNDQAVRALVESFWAIPLLQMSGIQDANFGPQIERLARVVRNVQGSDAFIPEQTMEKLPQIFAHAMIEG